MQIGVSATGFPTWADLLGRSPCASTVAAYSAPRLGLVSRPCGPWPRGPQPVMGRYCVRVGGPPAWLAGPHVPRPLGRPVWVALAEAGPGALFFF